MPLRLPALRFRVPPPTAPRRAVARAKPARAVAWGVVAFAVLQYGLGLASEVYPRVRDPLFGDKFVKLDKKLAATPPGASRPATVVMLGSSRTGLGFHGKRVEAELAVRAFNFGVPASGPVTHLLYLNRLLAAGVVPDLLLVEVLPSMLADTGAGPLEEHWFFPDRVTHAERATLIRHGFAAGLVRERYAKSVLLPWFALRFQVVTRVAPSWVPWQLRFDWSRSADECGWGTPLIQVVTPEYRKAAEAQARAEYAGVLADLRPGGGAVSALRELLETCEKRGIPVRLVLMPEGSTFRAMYPPHVRERIDTFLRGLGVPVIDARGWLPDDVFTDGHHQLAAGAEAFSTRLAREAIGPALREGSAK